MRKNEAEVLAYLNGLRVQYVIGEPLSELPPDFPATARGYLSRGCPVAVALSRECGLGCVQLGGDVIYFPDFVTEFQAAHDRRRRLS